MSEERVYRGIPEHAKKEKVKCYYAAGPQPERTARMLYNRVKAIEEANNKAAVEAATGKEPAGTVKKIKAVFRRKAE